jgi:hypothetical protein
MLIQRTLAIVAIGMCLSVVVSAKTLCGSDAEILRAATRLNNQLNSQGVKMGSVSLSLFQQGHEFTVPQSVCIDFMPGEYRVEVVCGGDAFLENATILMDRQVGQSYVFASAVSPAPDAQHASYACSVIPK